MQAGGDICLSLSECTHNLHITLLKKNRVAITMQSRTFTRAGVAASTLPNNFVAKDTHARKHTAQHNQKKLPVVRIDVSSRGSGAHPPHYCPRLPWVMNEASPLICNGCSEHSSRLLNHRGRQDGDAIVIWLPSDFGRHCDDLPHAVPSVPHPVGVISGSAKNVNLILQPQQMCAPIPIVMTGQ